MSSVVSRPSPLVVTPALRAVELQSVVRASPVRAAPTIRAPDPDVTHFPALPPERERSIAVSSDGTLVPNQLYPSGAASEANVRFYLPKYVLRMTQGRHTTSLRFRAETDSPDGPLGWLTVELEPEPPRRPEFELREIPHQVQLRLGYRMPVADEKGQPVALVAPDAGGSDAAGAKLWIALGPLARDGQGAGVCRFPFHAREEFDNLFQILTDPVHEACLNIEYEATVGRWTQNMILLSAAQRQTPGGAAAGFTRFQFASTAEKLQFQPAAQVAVARAAGTERVQMASLSRLPEQTGVLRANRAVAASARRTPMIIRPAVPSRPVESRPIVARPVRPPVATRPIRPRPPIKIPPIRPPDGESGSTGGRPANRVLVEKIVALTEEMKPFVFPLEKHGYMFDVPEDPVKNRILLRHTITLAGGDAVTFYQDSLFRGQVFYEPQEFRLSRYSTDPFGPSILFAFTPQSETVAGGADEPGASYDVRMAYWATPFLAPKSLLAARQHFGAEAAFAPLMPKSSSLTLRLPEAEGAGMSAADRADATISFEDGIRDEFSMSQGQFERVFAGFISPGGVGIEGTLKATLSDGSSAELPVNLSLRENDGDLFDRTFKGPVADAPGMYEVELRNRIESPVRIREVFAVPVAAGVTAFPEGTPPAEPVAPGAAATLRYRLVPEGAPLFDIEPSMDLEIDLDLPRIHHEITLNELPSETTREVRVSIDPIFFETAPPGAPALTAVKVEFEGGETIELTSNAVLASVNLVVPLLVRLLLQSGEEEDFSYGYKVACEFADGSSDVSGPFVGLGNLEIIPEVA